MVTINGVTYYPENIVKAAATDLGMVMLREIILSDKVTALSAANAALTEQNEHFQVRLQGYEADIDALRKQLGAKPKVRPGQHRIKSTE